jgi:hypothetical protein
MMDTDRARFAEIASLEGNQGPLQEDVEVFVDQQKALKIQGCSDQYA